MSESSENRGKSEFERRPFWAPEGDKDGWEMKECEVCGKGFLAPPWNDGRCGKCWRRAQELEKTRKAFKKARRRRRWV